MIRSLSLCFLYAVLNVTGAAIIKWRLKGRTLSELNDWIKFIFDFQTIGALFIVFLSALVLFKALSTNEFTFIIPVVTGINFVLTIIAGYYIFKDQLNYLSFIGFALIVSGIVILSLNNTKHA